MTGQDDTFLVFNKVHLQADSHNVGPQTARSVFPEEAAPDVLSFNLPRPTTTLDDQGSEVGLVMHGLTADALERILAPSGDRRL